MTKKKGQWSLPCLPLSIDFSLVTEEGERQIQERAVEESEPLPVKGGEGSGYHDPHNGRPGEMGGSAPRDGSAGAEGAGDKRDAVVQQLAGSARLDVKSDWSFDQIAAHIRQLADAGSPDYEAMVGKDDFSNPSKMHFLLRVTEYIQQHDAPSQDSAVRGLMEALSAGSERMQADYARLGDRFLPWLDRFARARYDNHQKNLADRKEADKKRKQGRIPGLTYYPQAMTFLSEEDMDRSVDLETGASGEPVGSRAMDAYNEEAGIKPADLHTLEAQQRMDDVLWEWKGRAAKSIADSAGITEQQAARILKEWNLQGGVDRSVLAPMLQDVASELFGTAPAEWQKRTGGDEKTYRNYVRDIAGGSEEEARRVTRAALKAMYDNTQAWLKSKGIDRVRLLRGVALSGLDDVAPGTPITFDDNVLSSWTLMQDFANRFVYLGSRRRGKSGIMLGAVVPASRILSIPVTGLGQSNEYEFVVIGSDKPAHATVLDNSQWMKKHAWTTKAFACEYSLENGDAAAKSSGNWWDMVDVRDPVVNRGEQPRWPKGTRVDESTGAGGGRFAPKDAPAAAPAPEPAPAPAPAEEAPEDDFMPDEEPAAPAKLPKPDPESEELSSMIKLPGGYTLRFGQSSRLDESNDLDGGVFDPYGKEIGGYGFSVGKEPSDIYIDILSLSKEAQDKGIALEFLQGVVEYARQKGFKTISFEADITIGRYAWAKYGFQYKTPDRAAAATGNFTYWAEKMGISAPAGGWPVFRTPQDVISYDIPGVRIPGRRIRNKDVSPDAQMNAGKAYMLDCREDDFGHVGHGDWDATIDVDRLQANLDTIRARKAGSGKAMKGGAGSGYYAPHVGRPGKVGGSSPRDGSAETEGEDLRQLVAAVKLPPGLYQHATSEKLGGKTVVDYLILDGPGSVVARYRISARKVSKSIRIDGIRVYERKDQQHGIAFAILEAVIDYARKHGRRAVTLLADITIGRYAWAKYGFQYTESDRAATASKDFIHWAKQRHIKKPAGGWPTFKTPQDVIGYNIPSLIIKGSEISNKDVSPDATMNAGKAFMLDGYNHDPDVEYAMTGHGDWEGYISVDDLEKSLNAMREAKKAKEGAVKGRPGKAASIRPELETTKSKQEDTAKWTW